MKIRIKRFWFQFLILFLLLKKIPKKKKKSGSNRKSLVLINDIIFIIRENPFKRIKFLIIKFP